MKGEQNSLIATLEKQQRKMEEGALLVELFADDVDKCMLVINSALTAGMSWDDIDTMVKAETAKGEYAIQCVNQFDSGSVHKWTYTLFNRAHCHVIHLQGMPSRHSSIDCVWIGTLSFSSSLICTLRTQRMRISKRRRLAFLPLLDASTVANLNRWRSRWI